MFLGEGLELVESDDRIEEVVIHQEDDAGPAFKVSVRILPIKEYRSVFAKLNNQNTTGGARQSQAAQDKVDRDYLTRVVKGWSGLTLDNWEAIVRDGKKITGAKADEMRKKNYEIPHSDDLSFYLYRNTWPQDYGNKVFDVVQAGATEDEEAEAEVKKA